MLKPLPTASQAIQFQTSANEVIIQWQSKAKVFSQNSHQEDYQKKGEK